MPCTAHSCVVTAQRSYGWSLLQDTYILVTVCLFIILFGPGLGLHCSMWVFSSPGAQASHCRGSSCGRAGALQLTGSEVESHRL